MERRVRITGPADRQDERVRFNAEDDHGPFIVTVPADAWDRLLSAFDWIDADDRRELALFEVEQLCAGHADVERDVLLDAWTIAVIAEQREKTIALH